MAKITINGQQIKVKNGTTILKAAQEIGVEIPTLCFIEEINEIGFCRICVVEVEGEQDLVSACNTEVTNGMVIYTDSEKVATSRETTLQLLASKHRFDCWRCPKDGMCEFYDLLKEHDVVFEQFGPGEGRFPDQIFGTGISQDQTKCVLCKRCVAVCQDVVTAKVLKFRDDDGLNPKVSPTPGLAFDHAGCIFCGQCVKVCPTGTLFETDHTVQVEEALRSAMKHTVVQLAPNAVAAVGEAFNLPLEDLDAVENKVHQALRLAGFDSVTTPNLGTDLLVEQEKNLLKARLESDEVVPLFTSHCPAAVRYLELYQPAHLDKLAPVKSAHVLQGSLMKHHYAKTLLNKKPEDIYMVSVMPCTSSKYEISRTEIKRNGVQDVDAVLTVRELVKLLKRKRISLATLSGEVADAPLSAIAGTYSSRSVMERVLNALSLEVDNKPLEEITYKVLRGAKKVDSEGVLKEATITINNKKINIAIAQGGQAMKEMYKRLETAKKPYHYIEFMACAGGCVNGGGMPIIQDLPMHEVIKNRLESYTDDKRNELLVPSNNNNLQTLYKDFLTEEVVSEFTKATFSQKEFTKE